MSKPRYRWWGFAIRMIRDYPSLDYKMKELHQQNITANISGMPGGGGNSRAVECIAMRQLPDADDQKAYEAVTKAVEITRLRPDGAIRLKMIELMYWKRKNLTAKAVAPALHISDATAKRWHGDFVRTVGICYGFKT